MLGVIFIFVRDGNNSSHLSHWNHICGNINNDWNFLFSLSSSSLNPGPDDVDLYQVSWCGAYNCEHRISNDGGWHHKILIDSCQNGVRTVGGVLASPALQSEFAKVWCKIKVCNQIYKPSNMWCVVMTPNNARYQMQPLHAAELEYVD